MSKNEISNTKSYIYFMKIWVASWFLETGPSLLGSYVLWNKISICAASSTTSTSINTDSPFQRKSYQSPISYQYPSSSKRPDSTYLVRRVASLGELSDQSRKTEIFPVKSSPTPPPPTRSKVAGNSNNQNQQFYTDRNFSKTFLSDSIPLSQMIVDKK